MNKLTQQVLEFHRVFGHPTADSPTIPPDERVRFRAAFIVEECLEFLEATLDTKDPRFKIFMIEIRNRFSGLIRNAPIKVDLPLAVDALADIDYVVEGTRLEFGVNGEPIADEVHRANMTKALVCTTCDGRGWRQKNDHDSEPCPKCNGKGRMGVVKRKDGKTLKPPGWTPPDIAGCLERQKPRGPQASPDSLQAVIAETI
jgi:predicted HAD superfamily Cof-like phosphohydrolase